MITDTSVWEMLLLFYGYFMGPLDLWVCQIDVQT
jgi:hypothetical protein